MNRSVISHPYGTERGWSLPTVLVTSALLASALTLVTSEALSIVRRAQSFSFGEKLRASTLSTAISTSLPSDGCGSVSHTSRDTTLTVSRCSEDIPHFASFPSVTLPEIIVDYDTLFRHPSSCPGTRTSLNRTTFTAPVAPFTCLLPPQSYSSLKFLDNIQAESLFISPPTRHETALFASPGSITVIDELSLAASTLIVAGGSIAIGTVRHDGDTAVKVTLFSARGDISVSQTRGKVSLLAIGRGDRNIPQTPFLAPFPLPPLRPRSIYGIIWGEP